MLGYVDRLASQAMNRPTIADRWDAAGLSERAKMLVGTGVEMYRAKQSKSIYEPWEHVAPMVQRRLALKFDNAII